MNQYLQGIVTILSLVNPLICGAIFSKISAGASWSAKVSEATKAALAIAVILCLAALVGTQVLDVFGISLPAFQVAGGMVLVWMGFIMLRGNSSPTSSHSDDQTGEASNGGDDDDGQSASLAPLILFAASPGTITGVITLAVSHSQSEIPVTALVSVGVAITITWLVVLLSARASGQQKQGLLHDVTSRFMGLIVLAMGVQFALSGLQHFFEPA
ncbi:MAG: MarC family protein [Pirellulaceae bacterium]